MKDDAAIRRVVRQIEAYLLEHPQAADTVDGVEAWWLGGAKARPMVERALERLVQQGVLRCSIGPQHQAVYSAGRRRAQAAAVEEQLADALRAGELLVKGGH